MPITGMIANVCGVQVTLFVASTSNVFGPMTITDITKTKHQDLVNQSEQE
jgi:hypothetical protein